MRLFAAVELEPDCSDEVARAVASAREHAPNQLRWLDAAGYHLTLQFFGQVDEALRPGLELACQAAAAEHAPFDLVLGGAGAFPRPRRARVVWIDVVEGGEGLVALGGSLRRHTAAVGMRVEDRPFRPHLTVARLRRPADVTPALETLQLAPTPTRVTHVTLFRSHLGAGGARYEALLRAALRDV